MIWEVVFVLLILKLPVAYVCWVVWWAVKAEPEVAEGESPEGHWMPWRRRTGSRPPRNGPHGAPARAPARAASQVRKAV